ncbi:MULTISPECIES: dihydroorotase [unclassified Pedobacter]|uniref:dihydroorotase n=1 Tax=unclassified Pedobacter TaxID=2628915 RepID=UPI0014227777|nr:MULTISPECIES: dihydroorotase [unclassified Pedobacter]NII81640.1 dihydroorotase [Pedobacter sp. SG908]NMN35644.1 dihydroorotase [Pedobacter sp. SG918]
MNSYLIKAATIVNEGQKIIADVLIKDGLIAKIAQNLSAPDAQEINAEGQYLLPGMIDDQVHFREPGLTHKADIFTESMAAVAGGITSFMEMPNTVPNTLTQDLLADKYEIAAQTSLANYSFYMGASNDNIEEVLKTDPKNVCGIKVFMGSSTGNMLVDNEKTLENIFSKAPILVATHCEDEATIRHNLAEFKAKYGEGLTIDMHPLIRSAEACYKSSSLAVELAKAYKTRLHILHISTAKEIALFDNITPLKDKKITAEACVHHLWFNDKDYASKGNFIKWNPAVKTEDDQKGVLNGILEDYIDVIATDHAPHTLAEKQQPYAQAPSGGPLVQHALPALLEMHLQGKISLEKIVEKTAHNLAICFDIEKRGFIREGYWADLVLVDLKDSWKVTKLNNFYKCGWSPFDGDTFQASITHTFVSGNLAYQNGKFTTDQIGKRLTFAR